MSPRSDGVFGGMEFITQEFGRSAIVTLQSFAPPSIHTELKAQLPRLVKIHDSGKMPYLGITGQYRWLLAVWSRPSPLVVCLLVWPVDHRRISIAEALQLEQEATGRASQSARQAVTIRPYSIPHNELGERVRGNLKNGRHWSHGMT